MSWVRSQAVRALTNLGPPTPSSRAVIVAALQDADPRVRTAGVEAIGAWGECEEPLTTTLLGLLEDPNDEVKGEVTRVLPQSFEQPTGCHSGPL